MRQAAGRCGSVWTQIAAAYVADCLCMCPLSRRGDGGRSRGPWQCCRPQQRRLTARAAAAAAWLQVEGTPERPRLAVFRSNNHIYAQVRRGSSSCSGSCGQGGLSTCRACTCRHATWHGPNKRHNTWRCPLPAAAQVIDDEAGNTLAASSTLNPEIRQALAGEDAASSNVEAARMVGAKIAELCKQKNIEKVGGRGEGKGGSWVLPAGAGGGRVLPAGACPALVLRQVWAASNGRRRLAAPALQQPWACHVAWTAARSHMAGWPSACLGAAPLRRSAHAVHKANPSPRPPLHRRCALTAAASATTAACRRWLTRRARPASSSESPARPAARSSSPPSLFPCSACAIFRSLPGHSRRTRPTCPGEMTHICTTLCSTSFGWLRDPSRGGCGGSGWAGQLGGAPLRASYAWRCWRAVRCCGRDCAGSMCSRSARYGSVRPTHRIGAARCSIN